MARYESSVKQIPFSVESVYSKLADLNNLQIIKERINDSIVQQQVRDVIDKMEFTTDSVSCDAGMVGTVSVEIVERDENKCVKFQSVSSPVPFTFWAQILPTSDSSSKMKLTVDAELNFFMKQMLDKPLKSGIEKMADMLAMIPYN